MRGIGCETEIHGVSYSYPDIERWGLSRECTPGMRLRQPCSIPAFSYPHLDCNRTLTWAQIVEMGEDLQSSFMPGTLNLTIPWFLEAEDSRQQCWKQGQ